MEINSAITGKYNYKLIQSSKRISHEGSENRAKIDFPVHPFLVNNFHPCHKSCMVCSNIPFWEKCKLNCLTWKIEFSQRGSKQQVKKKENYKEEFTKTLIWVSHSWAGWWGEEEKKQQEKNPEEHCKV